MTTDATTGLTNSEIASLARATSRGTKIVKKGQEMDQNSFLKILSAELTNQDPTNAKDGTEFVAQMAQFASLEQMTNINSSISFSTSTSLVGKVVAFSSYDSNGVQYGGTVKAVFQESGATYMAVKLSDGSVKDFPADTLTDVIDVPDNTLEYLNGNMVFSAAISLIGKQVKTVTLDDGVAYSGTVKSVFKDTTGIKLTIAYDKDGVETTKDINYEDISKAE
ncbi:flagellar hook capping FlgD N-terminal domain-containing protein [Clostridium lacusfryxellense]|uniref:flagellar hook capping FlgD N-terminal domain-containing protein n=1 Tax=Clostridium lacusfryxellense TaxID=205328 RepID=UPI001C0D5B2F|nr:flagellar hook capping FlgD N-terminal domain-containing protein [Clostridium lacusfryxellense]MBU3111786.1 flagellar biosynthesis protein FlgD [Clostridium lacusfryxellense]